MKKQHGSKPAIGFRIPSTFCFLHFQKLDIQLFSIYFLILYLKIQGPIAFFKKWATGIKRYGNTGLTYFLFQASPGSFISHLLKFFNFNQVSHYYCIPCQSCKKSYTLNAKILQRSVYICWITSFMFCCCSVVPQGLNTVFFKLCSNKSKVYWKIRFPRSTANKICKRQVAHYDESSPVWYFIAVAVCAGALNLHKMD